MAPAVDEEGWCPGHAGQVRRLRVAGDARGAAVVDQVLTEAVEVERSSVLEQVVRRQPVLMLQEPVLHLPEASWAPAASLASTGRLRVRWTSVRGR